MTGPQLQQIETRWRAYVDRFRRDGRLHPMQQLKLEHSVRVSADARAIAKGTGRPEGGQNLAEAVGLLHDTARFPQFEQYKTFSDTDSVDHGDLGFQTLEKEEMLCKLPGNLRKLILHSVRHHNKKDLPDTLTAPEETCLRIIRDADRLDIFFVCWDAVASGQIHEHPDIMMNVDFNGPPTDAVLDQFERGEAIDYRNLQSMADRFILLLNWMHDLSYAASKRLVRERGILDKFIDVLPAKTARLMTCFDETRAFLSKEQ
jgi:hypothetical protein